MRFCRGGTARRCGHVLTRGGVAAEVQDVGALMLRLVNVDAAELESEVVVLVSDHAHLAVQVRFVAEAHGSHLHTAKP